MSSGSVPPRPSPDADRRRYVERAREVLTSEARGIEEVLRNLEQGFPDVVELLLRSRGRVVITGVGKSGLVGRKVAATLTSTGTPAHFMHPVDAVHGDLGILDADDVVILFSKSGETEELIRMVPLFRRARVPIVLVTAVPRSSLGRTVDHVLDVGDSPEASSVSLVPTTSTTAALALGDALAVVVMESRGFKEEDFAFLHPGGVIGRQIGETVADRMHRGKDLPLVQLGTPMRDCLVEIVRGRIGMTTVVNHERRLVGVVTDGDLKRILLARGNALDVPVEEVMTASPRTIAAEAPILAALERMENNPGSSITSLVVVDDDHRPVGVIHIHDCLKP